MYEIILQPAARRDLDRLDVPIRRRVVERLDWVAEHFDELQPEPLTGQYAGQFKIRVGDYRILYQFDRAAHTLTIFKVRHRREVYD